MTYILGLVGDSYIYLFRIILAAVCGAFIGIEREHRTKVAGLRTHIIISMAAALMMIISKYGFLDALTHPGTSVDVARVAAGIITGVGILSGGIIFIGKRGNVSGLTTAAGVWATIGIGMAIGAGMYVVGVGVAVLVELIQHFRSDEMESSHHPYYVTVTFMLESGGLPYSKIEEYLSKYDFAISELKWERKSKKEQMVRCAIIVPQKYSRNEIIAAITEIPETVSCQITGTD